MKSLIIIWIAAIGTFVGVYAYIFISICDMCKAASGSITLGGVVPELKVVKSGDGEMYNPQKTVNGTTIQGGR